MFRKYIFCINIMFILTSCAAQTGLQDFSNSVKSIEQGLQDEDLVNLKSQVNELKDSFKKHQWKIQLLGDEGEYERLHESISRLIAAIDAGELSDAHLELATIKTIIEDIYSL